MLLSRLRSEHQPSPPPATTEEAEVRLLARVASGELQAFETLYRAYYPRLTRFLERLTRRSTLVDEVLNDAMLVVWHRADSFNGQSKVSTWIFAIAYRKALKALKGLDEPVEADADTFCGEAAASPEQQVGQQQLHALLEQALAHLSVDQRAVVDLTYFHGIGYREIADIVGCPVDTVKTRMFHARRRLRSLLAGQLEDLL